MKKISMKPMDTARLIMANMASGPACEAVVNLLRTSSVALSQATQQVFRRFDLSAAAAQVLARQPPVHSVDFRQRAGGIEREIPAVDWQERPGDHRRGIRGEEQDRPDDLMRKAEPPRWEPRPGSRREATR